MPDPSKFLIPSICHYLMTNATLDHVSLEGTEVCSLVIPSPGQHFTSAGKGTINQIGLTLMGMCMQLSIALNGVSFRHHYLKLCICETVFTRVCILWIEVTGYREKCTLFFRHEIYLSFVPCLSSQ